jgi:hypothetical protein
MYKNATKCNETIGKWCKTKHGASKIIDTFETYQIASQLLLIEHSSGQGQLSRLLKEVNAIFGASLACSSVYWTTLGASNSMSVGSPVNQEEGCEADRTIWGCAQALEY